MVACREKVTYNPGIFFSVTMARAKGARCPGFAVHRSVKEGRLHQRRDRQPARLWIGHCRARAALDPHPLEKGTGLMSGDSSMNTPPVPLSVQRRVDAVCQRFEAAWKAGQCPPIEPYLGETPEPERSE